MQLGRIGDNHSAEMHQVTQCLHDHGHSADKGGASMQPSPDGLARQALQANQEQQAQLTLTEWVQGLLRNGKQRLLGFWYGGEYTSEGDRSEKTGSGQIVAQSADAGEKNTAKVSGSAKEATVYNNPYFAAVPAQPHSAAVSMVQKIKLKCSSIAGQLAKHLPGRFSGFQKKGSSQAKKEGNREDLRKRSRYREDELEIDCVLTDESYLMDSYDRKGEYRQLTTQK